MTNLTHGYSGGVTTDSGNDGVFVYSLPPSKLPKPATGKTEKTISETGRDLKFGNQSYFFKKHTLITPQ